MRSTLPLFPLASLLLGSCGVQSFRSDFVGYNKAYAGMLNEQMLLNLARLDNGHPAYFMTVGAIDAKYTYGQEAGATYTDSDTTGGSRTTNSNASGGVLGLASQAIGTTSSIVNSTVGNVRLSRNESPNFKIIPLNDSEISRQVLNPIPTDAFYSLYQQGYPIDLLMRVMVERIEISGNSGTTQLVNSPRGSSETYIRFLNACAVLREAQKSGALSFNTEQTFQELADHSPADFAPRNNSRSRGDDFEGAFRDDPGDILEDGVLPQAEGGNEPPVPKPVPPRPSKPTADQIVAARKESYDYRQNDKTKTWKFGKWRTSPFFSLSGSVDGTASKLSRNPRLSNVDSSRIRLVVEALHRGIEAKGSGGERSDGTSARLILRSYSRTLDAVASEQRYFYSFISANGHRVAETQHQPVIRTRWDGAGKTEKPLVSVSYQGKPYAITDESGSTSTRDAFRLLVGLSSQVNVDISKFQNQVLEVR